MPVPTERAKPAPDLYLQALNRFGLRGDGDSAFEDFHNGSIAAKRVGFWCMAIPNEITDGMDFSHTDMVPDSLSDFRLDELNHRLST